MIHPPALRQRCAYHKEHERQYIIKRMVTVIQIDTPDREGAIIRVIGAGGGGGNAVNSMISRGLVGVDFIAANTDSQALVNNKAAVKIQLGKQLTRGLGAGAKSEVGLAAAEESLDEIKEALQGSDMVFVTAGMGGGTGTGSAPVIAKAARELGALVVAIVTKPFRFEAPKRMRVAEEGIKELRKNVDALIVIPNEKLLSVIEKNTPLLESFNLVNDVLYHATRGMADIISGHGLINVDFADACTVMRNTGDAVMGTGIARGENRAFEAAKKAISSPLLENTAIEGAQGVLVNITATSAITMTEVQDAVAIIEKAAGNDTNLIFGVVIDESKGEEMHVTVVATGFKRSEDGTMTPRVEQAQPADVTTVVTVEEEPVARPRPIRPAFEARPAAAAGQPIARPAADASKSPRGVDELQQYDTPTYLRKTPTQVAPPQPAPQQQQQQQQKSSRPTFLRKIMD